MATLTFTTIDVTVPDAVHTLALGINNRGAAVPAPSSPLLLGTGLAFGAAWTRIPRRRALDRHVERGEGGQWADKPWWRPAFNLVHSGQYGAATRRSRVRAVTLPGIPW